jgi:hypothetical protein
MARSVHERVGVCVRVDNAVALPLKSLGSALVTTGPLRFHKLRKDDPAAPLGFRRSSRVLAQYRTSQ